jgi:CheY-like chemotaxis protein
MATKNEYQVIFMDLNMPIMDGFEAIKKIRIFDANTPIIVVTANTSSEDMKLVYEYGASGHIHKPICKQAIVEELVNVCISSGTN